MRAMGATAEEIDIRPSCMQMLKDIGHPFAKGKKVYDITFENVQAGERTSHLFRLANLHGGMVVGTGDLSELALGLVHLRRGRPHVPLQRERQRAEDADPVPRALGRRIGRARRPTSARRCAASSTPTSRPSSRPAASAPRTSSGPTSCRTSTSTTRCASATRRPRSRSSPGTPGATSTPWPTSANGSACSSTASSAPASSSAARCRTRPRWAPAAPSRRAATGARRRTAMPMSGSPTWSGSRKKPEELWSYLPRAAARKLLHLEAFAALAAAVLLAGLDGTPVVVAGGVLEAEARARPRRA